MKCEITSAHEWVYYAVEGAVRNVARHHPDWKLSRDKARSIAKRAAGTLTAEPSWPKALAAEPSEQAESRASTGVWPPPSRFVVHRTGSPQVHHLAGGRASKGSVAEHRRSPLQKAWKRLSFQAGQAKRDGKTERAEALIDALRIIDKCLT